MFDYQRNRKRIDAAIRNSGIVVVMNASHIKTAEHAVTTMQAVYEAGYVAEITFRIDGVLLREAMKELVKLRSQAPEDKPFVLGVGVLVQRN